MQEGTWKSRRWLRLPYANQQEADATVKAESLSYKYWPPGRSAFCRQVFLFVKTVKLQHARRKGRRRRQDQIIAIHLACSLSSTIHAAWSPCEGADVIKVVTVYDIQRIVQKSQWTHLRKAPALSQNLVYQTPPAGLRRSSCTSLCRFSLFGAQRR